MVSDNKRKGVDDYTKEIKLMDRVNKLSKVQELLLQEGIYVPPDREGGRSLRRKQVSLKQK